LTEAKAAEQELEKRVQVLKFNNQGQVKSQEVPLKAFPYNHSSTVVTLEKGETVTILATAKYWYRVRTPKGEEGWIYYVFLGPLT
jgi:SH3-like domain-containing protein